MVIIVLIVSLLVSLVPSIVLYKWLRKKSENKEICKKTFVKGVLSVFPIILTSLILYIIGRLSGFEKVNVIAYRAYYTFIVLAFAEELIKFLTFKNILKNNEYKYSWFDLIILMILVGLGFGCIENVTLALDSGIIVMVIRGISIGHAGYGFIMGWLYGKMLKTGKKIYGVLSFLIPWLLHGLYDFGLSEELIKINDNFALISVSLEIVCIITAFLIIRFVRKNQNSDIYREPLEFFNQKQ